MFTNESKPPPPHSIRLVPGYVHVTVSRAFADYVVNSPVAQDFLFWANDTRVPDEVYFSTLQHCNTHLKIPGSFIGKA